ncbi:DUF190 domain-containing protein [Streptomyces sp. NPDC050418]|uniref:DUF190 domain-containing protein n=1 Tax=Streptomyces sp. NPDC050418 TaxID=3365612 RepID=UPI0037B33A0A
MLGPGPAARLTIHVSGSALWHHKPLYAEIVHRARAYGLAGASVLHATHGFGPHLTLHADRTSRLTRHGPCAVVIVDDETRLRAFAEELHDALGDTGLVVLDRVTVYRAG